MLLLVDLVPFIVIKNVPVDWVVYPVFVLLNLRVAVTLEVLALTFEVLLQVSLPLIY